MKQQRTSRRHRRDAHAWDPLPQDPRDPDVVRAKRLRRAQERSW
jgi:hypothetical protein